MNQHHEPFNDPSASQHDNSIAVVGMAGRFAGAPDLDAYWQNLRNGVESIVTLTDEELRAAGVGEALIANPAYVKAAAPLPDMEMFDAGFFGMSPREAAIMDPQHRHFLECAWAALEDAAHPPERFPGAISVFAGCGFSAYLPFNLLTNQHLVDSVGMFLLRHTGNDKDFLSTRVSYLFNLKGPSVNVQTACSTSLVAIHMAAQSLLNRECDMALAGGSTVELPHRQGYLHETGGILSPDGHCRAFDADAQGTVFGSGVGAVVLRRLADAVADGDHIYAVIRGSAINNDGAGKVGYLAPSVDGQANAISEALAIADVSADTITYVEAHGTGTPVGDPIEIAALNQAFGMSTDEVGYCAIGSVKGNIGHTDTAAGVAGFIKVALAIKHGELPPTLHFAANNPSCAFDHSPFYVSGVLRPWAPPMGVPRRAGISSLGVGGTNAHVVLEQPPRRRAVKSKRPHNLLTVSGRSPAALEANVAALGAHLAANPSLDIGDVAYTLQIGRQAMKHRRSVIVADTADAAAVLADPTSPRLASGEAAADSRDVVFMFAGGGSQYPNMGLDLYQAEPVFREAVDECLDMLALHSDLDIRALLYPAEGDEAAAARELARPSIGLPALFTIQYAQAKLWMSWDINPKAMIGHSLGEYMAAHLAGVFSLGDALALVVLRGKLFESLPAGRMLSVSLPEAELRPLLGPSLSIAAVNAPAMTVASGPVEAIEALEALLAEREVPHAPIPINIAAHSAMLQPILAEFGAFFGKVAMRSPKKPFISNVTGTWITPAEAVDANYWVGQMRGTVRFADGLAQLLKDPNYVLLEVGPGRTLASLARGNPLRQPGQGVFNSLRHPDDKATDTAYLLDVLGRLWTVGAPVNWGRYWQNETRLRLPLPTYRFDRQRHWIEPGQSLAAAGHDPDAPLARNPDPDKWFYQPTWQRADRAVAAPETFTTLVFEDDCGLGTPIVEALALQGRDVVRIRAGRRFARPAKSVFTIDPAAPGDYEAVIARLADEGRAVRQVFHLWTVSGAARQPADILQRRGFYSLLHLAQAIGAQDSGVPLDLVVVSDHLQRVSTETDLVPAKATVIGACKVIPREYPGVRARSIDIRLPAAGSRELRDLVEDLVAEAGAADDAEVVAYRAGERWTQAWTQVRLARAPARTLRVGGVYLITGGLGGIGLTLARHLAETVAARLVLVGRSGLPPRSQWSARLASFDADDPVAERIRQVIAIERLGAEVLVVGADVCNVAQMKHAVAQARSRFGAIDGVFHTAGVIDDGVAQLKDAEAAAAVLAPKLRGTLVLEEALAGEKPAFLMLFSSISANVGLAGQIDYAAANAFLDAYAQSRAGQDGPQVIAVDWSQWQEVGMAAALAQELGLAAGQTSPARPSGHSLLGDCVRDTAVERTWETRLAASTHWLLDEHRTADGQALIPGTGYLEIVRAALAQHPEQRPVEIANLVFLAAFAVEGDAPRALRVQLRRQGDGWRFAVSGRAADSTDEGDWLEHVRGEIAYVDALRPAAVETASLLARCRVASHAGDLPSSHMAFGPRWRNIERIDYGASEAVLRLALPESFASELAGFPLHPALMDFATAGAQALLPGFDDAKDFFVPASYGRVRIHAPLPPRLISHVRYRGDGGADAGLATYDVTIMDEAGEVLVEIADFTMLRLAEGAFRAAAPRAAATRPHAVANGVLSQGHDSSILPSEGMAVIDRILDARTGPQIVVCPQPLNALVERLRKPLAPASGAAPGASGKALGGAPVGAAEMLVAELWSEMLGVAEVGRGDDFFDLGGHSLLAVQLVNKLKRRTGKALPLTALLEASTVQALAALIDPTGASSTTADAANAGTPVTAVPDRGSAAVGQGLVRIRAGGSGTPVFFVHDGLGETLLYRTLALKLDAAHPIFGLQPQVRADGSFVHTEIATMAAAHIEKVREAQPTGPYLLAGLCAGGVIAFEMARQLQDRGERVLFVGIIDAADVEAAERSFYVTRQRLHGVLATLGAGTDEPVAKRLAMLAPRIAGKALNAARYEVGIRLENRRTARAIEAQRRAAAERDGFADAEPEEGEAPSFLKMYQLAHRRHRPQGLFAGGDVVLFKATAGTGAADDAPFSEQFSDRVLGWGKRAADEVRVIEIPGGHSSALQQPHVGVLARAMQECIAEALLKAAPASPAAPAPATVARAAATPELVDS